MAKRKSPHDEESVAQPAQRRSARLQISADATATTTTETNTRHGNKLEHSTKNISTKKEAGNKKAKSGQEAPPKKGTSHKQSTAPVVTAPAGKAAKRSVDVDETARPASVGVAATEDRTYWLLKAEPESRFENGVDVKFSIDDLAARTEPEPWDGIRAYAARNNLRAMKKGDLAFFYHSNCKEPGIVGTMEIVQEHSPDLSAHDSKAPYYDPKSKPSDPKWSVVHVKFRSKFAVQIGLKELREMGGTGEPLENMQMLKQSRLSVSKVNAAEWEYITSVAERKASQKQHRSEQGGLIAP